VNTKSCTATVACVCEALVLGSHETFASSPIPAAARSPAPSVATIGKYTTLDIPRVFLLLSHSALGKVRGGTGSRRVGQAPGGCIGRIGIYTRLDIVGSFCAFRELVHYESRCWVIGEVWWNVRVHWEK